MADWIEKIRRCGTEGWKRKRGWEEMISRRAESHRDGMHAVCDSANFNDDSVFLVRASFRVRSNKNRVLWKLVYSRVRKRQGREARLQFWSSGIIPECSTNYMRRWEKAGTAREIGNILLQQVFQLCIISITYTVVEKYQNYVSCNA